MSVLYIHQYFKSPSEPGGTRSYWFSKELINNSHEVIMLTSRNKQKRLVERENIDGINVIYIKNKYENNYGFFRRLYSFTRFMLISTFVAFRQKDIKLVYATSTPLTVGFPALLLKKIKRTNYIFEVRDLWPEVPIQMGGLNHKLLQRIAIWFEKTIYKNALHIVALSPGMREGVLKRGIKPEKVAMIPNMAKTDKFFLREKNIEFLNKHNLSLNKFYVIHFGAMGIANGLQYIIKAAKIITERNIFDIEFLFAGEGGQEQQLKKLVKEYNLANVRFLGQFNMDEMSEIVNISDCSITSFLNLPILGTNSPNKLFDSLSAQKPIIVNSSGWTKDIVEEHNCGAYVDPEKPEELADILIEWKNNPDKVLKMGVQARKLAEKKYDKSILSNDFKNLITGYLNQ